MYYSNTYLITKPKLLAYIFISTRKFGQTTYSDYIFFLNRIAFKSFISMTSYQALH